MKFDRDPKHPLATELTFTMPNRPLVRIMAEIFPNTFTRIMYAAGDGVIQHIMKEKKLTLHYMDEADSEIKSMTITCKLGGKK